MSGRHRVLVAGIGNVFLGDDGFGVEVARRLAADADGLPPGARVVDYGIRGVHLAYDLLDDPPGTLVLVDAVPLDDPPGTLAVLQPPTVPAGAGRATVDGHGLHPEAVLRLLHDLGGSVANVLVVGCAPAVVDAVMGLSPPVEAAVEGAVRLVRDICARAAEEAPLATS